MRTATHFRAITRAYYAGHSEVIISEDDLDIGDVNMHEFAQVLREARRTTAISTLRPAV